jgi:WD40 repeat protein
MAFPPSGITAGVGALHPQYFNGHSDTVYSAKFSPDGRRVVTASFDRTALIWDARTGQKVAHLYGHNGPVTSAAFSPDGQYVVTASFDKTARVWDAETGIEIGQLQGHKGIVLSAVFSPDGQGVATASQDTTGLVWDATARYQLIRLHQERGEAISLGHNGDFAIDVSINPPTWNMESAVRIWDARTGDEVAKLQSPRSLAAISNGGQHAVTAYGKTAWVWDVKTGQKLSPIQGHEDTINSVNFSWDGQRVVTTSQDKTARIWDTSTGHEIVTFKEHEGAVYFGEFSPDGRRVVTGGYDKTARVWSADTGQEAVRLKGHLDAVQKVAFSLDGQRVMTGGMDGTYVWDLETGREATLPSLPWQGQPGAFSPDGRHVVLLLGKDGAGVWDVATGVQVAQLGGHTGLVTAAVFSPDGQHVITASSNTLRVWYISWLVQSDSQALIKAVCDEKLSGVGASILNSSDVAVSPVITHWKGEDVCAFPSFLDQISWAVGLRNSPK